MATIVSPKLTFVVHVEDASSVPLLVHAEPGSVVFVLVDLFQAKRLGLGVAVVE